MNKTEYIDKLKNTKARGILHDATFGGALTFAIGLAEQLVEPPTEPSAIAELIADNERLMRDKTALECIVSTDSKRIATLEAENERLHSEIRELMLRVLTENAQCCHDCIGDLGNENGYLAERVAVLERALNIIKEQLVLWTKINAGSKHADLMAQAVDNAIEQAKQELADEEGELI